MVIAIGQVTIKPFGLVGHQNVGGYWSNKTRLSLIQDPSNVANFLLKERFPLLGNPGPILEGILERFAPELLNPVQPANTTSTAPGPRSTDSTSTSGNPRVTRSAASGCSSTSASPTGIANPVKYSYMVGIGGNGVVPGRPDDNFGIGWARTQFSNNFVPLLRERFDLGLDQEDVVEAFYNAAITKWLRISLDLQVINPGLQKTLSDDRNSLKGVNNVVVGGVRTYIRF